MDRKASVCNPLDLERMLIDERAEPRNLRLSLLESITNNFSGDLEIGSGGFAVVYKGILQNGAVAVKKLSKTLDVDERKFQQEIDSLMRAKHKNIVRFLGYCSDTQGIVHKFNGRHVIAEERQRFLCFEFVPLGSLDKYISDASGGLEWRTRFQIIRGICEGLHYLHQQRIVHLDLKPGNILLDHYMLPKIADFGLSKCFDEKQSGAVTSNPCGTRGYMAPESHDGVITLKSDIYSLGIIIIEILTGQRCCPVIENVLETWSIRFETLKGDTRLEPIRVCIEIGMECTDFNPTKRTDTGRIIARLDEMELKYGIIVADICTSSETEASSSVSKLVDEVQQSMFMSDEASSPLQQITSSVPKGLGEASSSSMLLSVDDEVESMDVSSIPSPLQLLTIEPKGPGKTGDEAAQQERSTFISSLLPLLSEYDNLQPSVLDAQSIVSNLKILYKHLQEQLLVNKEKLRASRYQITPWHTGLSNNSPTVPTDPPAGKAVVTTSKNSLDIVSPTAYPQVQSPMSSPIQARGEWGVLGNKNHQVIPSEVPTKNSEHDDMGGTSLSSRNQFRMDVPAQVSQHDSHAAQFDFKTQSHNPPFKGLGRTDMLDGSENAEPQNAQESSARWVPRDSTNLASGLEDANPSYPYLPTVLEEPGSSFSEEDDPLPGIDGLRITGEPFPGRELQASGFPINGTTTCNFEWVRHLEDGSVNFIEGARQPSYVVTADDVDTILAIEVQPLDDRKRKGDFIKVYANEQRKITCDPETKELIKRTLEIGHVTYEAEVRFLDMWEPAVLAIKREGYSIKCNGRRGVVITEKFLQATGINISYGSLSEFSITSADGVDYNLKPAENTLLRDTIVLVLRLFKNMAVERRRGRKKGLFFK